MIITNFDVNLFPNAEDVSYEKFAGVIFESELARCFDTIITMERYGVKEAIIYGLFCGNEIADFLVEKGYKVNKKISEDGIADLTISWGKNDKGNLKEKLSKIKPLQI